MTIPVDSSGLFRCPECGKVHRMGQCEKQQKIIDDTFRKEVLKRLDQIVYLLEVGLGLNKEQE